MNKQEKIAEAYGEIWDLVKDKVDANGWCSMEAIVDDTSDKPDACKVETFLGGNYLFEMREPGYTSFRPLSLQGIEDNNGWKKIEGNGDLPEYSGFFWVVTESSKSVSECFYFKRTGSWQTHETVTHYQPIVKPEFPLY